MKKYVSPDEMIAEVNKKDKVWPSRWTGVLAWIFVIIFMAITILLTVSIAVGLFRFITWALGL